MTVRIDINCREAHAFINAVVLQKKEVEYSNPHLFLMNFPAYHIGSLMGVNMGFRIMPRMVMVVPPMRPRMIMVMGLDCPVVRVFVQMLMQVLVGMPMGVLMAVRLAVMRVVMRVRMTVVMRVQMFVFVCSFHN
ncbi:MAG: hypothetical protein V2B19_15525 [Pseudomonadota bacterium]